MYTMEHMRGKQRCYPFLRAYIMAALVTGCVYLISGLSYGFQKHSIIYTLSLDLFIQLGECQTCTKFRAHLLTELEKTGGSGGGIEVRS